MKNKREKMESIIDKGFYKINHYGIKIEYKKYGKTCKICRKNLRAVACQIELRKD
jgi:hypothetical protein